MKILKFIAVLMALIPILATAQFQYNEFELLASTTETASDSLGAAVSTITQITNNDRTSNQQRANDRLNKTGGDMRCYLDVTAFGGTSPTLDVDIIGVINGIDHLLVSFTQVGEAASQEAITIVAAPDDIDVDWTISGSAGQTYTFNIQCHRN